MKIIYILILLLSISFCSNAQTRQWVSCYADSSVMYPSDAVTDSAGNTYITGYFYSGVHYDLTHYYVLKHNRLGQQEWINFFPYKDSFSVGKAITLDKAGNIYVTGERYDTSCNICTITVPYSYAFTIKYNPAGKILWGNSYNGPDHTNQTPAEITVAADGNVYTVINEKKYNSVTFNYNYSSVTQRINKNGKTSWIRKMKDVNLKAVTTDINNNPVVTGAYVPGNTYQLSNILTMKYTSTGDSVWQQRFTEYQKNGTGYFIKTDKDGNVYVNGQTDTLTFYNVPRIITLKYAPAGNLLWWQKEATHTYTMPHIYGGYTIDRNGNSYIAGYNSTNYPNDDWTVVKRNRNGKIVWQQTYSDSLNGSDKPSGGIAVDSKGNVTVAGYSNFYNNIPLTTIQYSSTGVEMFKAFYKPAPKTYSFPYDIGLDAADNVYVTGTTGGICVVKYKTAVSVAALTASSLQKSPVAISIAPNPAKDYINIQTGALKPGLYNYTVTSVAGSVVLKQSLQINGQQNILVSVSKLSAGTYFLRLNGNDKSYVFKFQKL